MHKSDRRRNQSKIDEINARKDLSDKEKQVAVEQLNKLKDNAIKAINDATTLTEINKQKLNIKQQLINSNLLLTT